MLCCDIVSASAQLVLAALLMNSQLAIWHIYLCVGATALANAFHGPAYASSIPCWCRTAS
jgi:hypothetical protein